MHDEKFIDIFADKYFQGRISNSIILLKDQIKYNGKHKEQIVNIVPFSKKYFEFINSEPSYDFIIVYNLNYEKAYLINHFRKTISTKFIWNFFGTELYHNPRYPFLKTLYGKYTKVSNNNYQVSFPLRLNIIAQVFKISQL